MAQPESSGHLSLKGLGRKPHVTTLVFLHPGAQNDAYWSQEAESGQGAAGTTPLLCCGPRVTC